MVIVSQALITFTIPFFSNENVYCFHPTESSSIVSSVSEEDKKIQFQSHQADYVNKYCENSTPFTQYFPQFIVIHGLLLSIPYFIWRGTFQGDFDSFFSVVSKIERLYKKGTGEYNQENFDRVTKLTKEYGGRKVTIFRAYIVMLLIELSICLSSIIFSAVLMRNFSFTFDCPNSYVEGILLEGWPLNQTVPCVYVSLLTLHFVRYLDFFLTSLAGALILYGLVWCAIRHTEVLGYKQVANFMFQSCLNSESYNAPPILSFEEGRHARLLLTRFCINPIFKDFMGLLTLKISFHPSRLFNPRIRNDLDFLLLLLYSVDASHGTVFKSIQV